MVPTCSTMPTKIWRLSDLALPHELAQLVLLDTSTGPR